MNAFSSLFEQTARPDTSETPVPAKDLYSTLEASTCAPDPLAEEQICSLVRHVFLPGWPRPARQVILSPVDETTDIGGICLQIGQALSAQVSGTACLVDADLHRSGAERKRLRDLVYSPNPCAGLRDSSHQLGENLWHVPLDAFLGEYESSFSAAWVHRRLEDLSLEFDYTIIRGPAAGLHSEAALVGHLCDGVILVLEANLTRRMAALKVKEGLRLAKARLLGVVLTRRTFPIPEAIYKRL